MLKVLALKFKEALISVFPVACVVILLNLTPLVQFSVTELVAFLVSAIFLILGIALFNLGADMAMTPMGEQVGSGLSKSRNTTFLVLICFVMGLLITVAEPDLTVLADQVPTDSLLLIATVGVGVGLFLVLAILKIIFKKDLSALLMCFYMLLFAIGSLLLVQGKGSFLAMSFDSGGVTTGPITVPFIMALGVGVALTLGGKHASENSFGLVALCSVGPILAVMLLMLFGDGQAPYELPEGYYMAENIPARILHVLAEEMKGVGLALGLIVVFFAVIQVLFLKLPKKKIVQIAVGILYTYMGLVIFLTSVNVGFMPVGFSMGTQLAGTNELLLTAISFFLGLVVVLAEPAVHVLNRQVEQITDGTVSKRAMLIALSIGVGVSLALSIVRIIFGFSILYYLVPGYFLSLGLSFFVPRMYTAIAFDSGGVASGPLTSTFILPFAIGVCWTQYNGSVDALLSNGFGIVAMVAMTPLITIQLLGFRAVMTRKVQEKIAMRRILGADDEQIIEFM